MILSHSLSLILLNEEPMWYFYIVWHELFSTSILELVKPLLLHRQIQRPPKKISQRYLFRKNTTFSQTSLNSTEVFSMHSALKLRVWIPQIVSPDLNPIEHAWDQLKHQVHAHDLRHSTLHRNSVTQLIRSMRQRFQAVIGLNGGNSCFWLNEILWLASMSIHYEKKMWDKHVRKQIHVHV